MLKTRGITEFINALGGNMRDRYAWGTQGPNGTVILRVWFDRQTPPDKEGRVWVEVSDWEAAKGKPKQERAYHRRIEHIQQVDGGAPCLLVFMHSKVPNSPGRREIKSYQDSPIYRGFDPIKRKGEWWMEIGEAIYNPLETLKPQ